MPDSSTQTAPRQFSFESMRLRVGDRLQLELAQSAAEQRHIVRLLGFLEGRSLMVTVPAASPRQQPLIEGDELVVRVFTGQGAFGFTSFVEQLIRRPFEYLHLGFPKRIEGRIIRNSPRVKAGLPAHVRAVEHAGAAISATLENLSASGTLLRSATPLGELGTALRIEFSVDVFGNASDVSINARICTSSAPSGEGRADGHQYGVEFIDVGPNDALVLQAFVYQTLVENPQNMV
jgi:c-di-GMP-binding flagellar brake protein YcgR